MNRLVNVIAGVFGACLFQALPASAEEPFNLDALVTAAKAEPPINIYDSTGKIVEMAENFSKKYGVKATGVKVSASGQLEMIIREAQAKNVRGDVVLITDAPAGLAQLLPQKFVQSWLPPDMKDKVPNEFQDPLAITTNANVWAYNTEVYTSCPVKNLWELTEPKWKGKVAFYDPLSKGTYSDWFNQMETHDDDKMAAAYKAQFGKDLEKSKESATAAWIKGFAANAPLFLTAMTRYRTRLARRDKRNHSSASSARRSFVTTPTRDTSSDSAQNSGLGRVGPT